MSNGSPNLLQVIFRYIFGTGNSSAITSRPNEIILKLVKIDVLEMEDVLFHLNSAVMMPDNPQGKSSTQGGGAGEEQLAVTGLKALALVFKQFEFDPDKRIIISAHTDTSGTPEFNFKLSDERAKGILYLLTKKIDDDGYAKNEWMKICFGRHKVEDYQQIMKHFEKKLTCGCDPGKVDDTWGDKTRTATQNFFKKTIPDKADALLSQVEKDSKKRWPVDAWGPVYNLYSEEIAESLEITIAELEILRKSSVHFITENKPFVGCGESFPIDQQYKDNYKSQKNRRVEILFFDKDEVPINKYGNPEIKCPADTKNVHKAEDCPLWRKFYFIPLYIDPKDLKSIVYHLQFVYYDRIKKKRLPVPLGLKINAYENGHKKIPTETVFKNGVYFVKVQFGNKIKDPARTEFYFEFETEDKWIFTKDDKTDPVVIIKKAEEIQKLDFTKKLSYYDLPTQWSSRNYWTRDAADKNKDGIFEDVFKNRNLKPLGNNFTKPAEPLIYSLDDIVLVDDAGSQNINNSAGNKPQDLGSNNTTKIDLSENSRITILYLDESDDYNLKIYKGMASNTYFSDVEFKKNLITANISDANKLYLPRVVIFCSQFFDITNKRTENNAKLKFEQGHILGARAAIHNDAKVHQHEPLHVKLADGTVPNNMKDYVQNNCGNYEVHYLHDCGMIKGNLEDKIKPLSYLIIYWNCRLEAHTDTPNDPNWRQNWEKSGFINSMDRTNRPYLLEKKSGSKEILIRLYHFYEAKLDGHGGGHKCIVRVAKADEDWMMPTEAKFCEASYQGQPDYYGGAGTDAATKDIDSSTYPPLMNHHEMGHATGLFDDYMYNEENKKSSHPWTSYHTYFGLPSFQQPYTAPGGPYYCDYISTMAECRNPRMRDFWHFVNWINDESGDDNNKKLKPFLDNTKFKLTYKYKKGGADKIIELELWNNKYRNPNKPAYEKSGFQFVNTEEGKADLLLYQLGGGETASMIDPRHKNNRNKSMSPRIIFQGIIVIRHKIGVKIIDAGPSWTVNDISTWIKRNLQKPLEDLNKYYFICSKNGSDFKNVLLLFNPHFKIYDAPVPAPSNNWKTAAPADSNFNVIVTVNAGNNFNAAGKNMQVENNVDKNKITSYLLGKKPSGAITKNDLIPIGEWLKSTLGVMDGSFNINDLP